MAFVTVAQSATTSDAFTLPRADRAFAVYVPSLNPPAALRMQFSAASGGPVFVDLGRSDGSGLVHVVTSGNGPAVGIVWSIPSPWARLSMLGAAQTDTRTFEILTVN